MFTRRPSGRWSLAVAILVVLAVRFVLAQSVVDPRIVEFDPSSDHSALGPDGQPIVTRYDLEFYQVGSSTPFTNISLGKPSPDQDGRIRVNFEASLQPLPPAGVSYVARVAAVGPGGIGRSDPSNDFTFQSGCTLSVNPTALSLAATASSGTIFVTAPAGCAWLAGAAASWVTITTGVSGTGSGSVGYSLQANPTTSPRSTSISIGDQTIGVIQSGASCTATISPTGTTVPAAGATGSVSVSSASGCSWSATSNASWITVTSGASGQASGTVGYSVAAYSGTSPRSGTLTIAGRTFTVTQNGLACTAALTPATATFPSDGVPNATIDVSMGSDCGWTAASNVNWITVTSGTGGQGNGSVGYSVAPHVGTAARTGTITIAGLTFTVTQGGITCTYAVSPATQSVAAEGGSMAVAVTAPSGCAWTSTEAVSWMSITSGSTGTGNGSVHYSVSTNSGTSSRTATLTVANQPVTVTQSASTCSYFVSPTTHSVASAGGIVSVNVTAAAGCTWRATENVSWLSIDAGGNGTGDGTVRFNVAPYSGSTSRTATVTVAGRSVSITQSVVPAAPTGLRIGG